MTIRMRPDARRDAILEVALRLARLRGLTHLTREHVAEAAGVSPSLVSTRFDGMAGLKRSVLDLAARRRVDLADDSIASGEWEWLRGNLSPSIRYRLLVNGDLGVDELARLIDQLKAQRSALMASRK